MTIEELYKLAQLASIFNGRGYVGGSIAAALATIEQVVPERYNDAVAYVQNCI